MARGKDFSSIAQEVTQGNAVFSTVEQSVSRKGQQGKASPQEATERASKLRTQGRKGCKALRINMAFSPDNHEFIRVLARISGKTMTEFTNFIIDAYRKEHSKDYDAARAIIDKLEQE